MNHHWKKSKLKNHMKEKVKVPPLPTGCFMGKLQSIPLSQYVSSLYLQYSRMFHTNWITFTHFPEHLLPNTFGVWYSHLYCGLQLVGGRVWDLNPSVVDIMGCNPLLLLLFYVQFSSLQYYNREISPNIRIILFLYLP